MIPEFHNLKTLQAIEQKSKLKKSWTEIKKLTSNQQKLSFVCPYIIHTWCWLAWFCHLLLLLTTKSANHQPPPTSTQPHSSTQLIQPLSPCHGLLPRPRHLLLRHLRRHAASIGFRPLDVGCRTGEISNSYNHTLSRLRHFCVLAISFYAAYVATCWSLVLCNRLPGSINKNEYLHHRQHWL